MLYAPEVQERAQKELDRVTAGSRLPTFSDSASLPYIEAVVKELLRWECVVPLGLPHVTRVDDVSGRLSYRTSCLIHHQVYNGMFIPAGTTILPNQYGMSHDESIYPNPMLFQPERYLGENKQRDPETIAFGFGARICPGRRLAQHMSESFICAAAQSRELIILALSRIWLNVASILSCFDIKRPLDGDGKEFLPSRTYTSGLTSRPEMFRCRIEPRVGWSTIIQDTANACH